MNTESVENLRQIIREELDKVPLQELRWAFSSSRPPATIAKRGQQQQRSWWQRFVDAVLRRTSNKAKTEKILRDLLVRVNVMINTGSFPEKTKLNVYEDTLTSLNPDLTDVVGHLFMKIEDLVGTMKELHNQTPIPSVLRDEEEVELSARERRKLKRVARDLIRGIQRDANRLMVRRSRRGARRYSEDEPTHHQPYF